MFLLFSPRTTKISLAFFIFLKTSFFLVYVFKCSVLVVFLIRNLIARSLFTHLKKQNNLACRRGEDLLGCIFCSFASLSWTLCSCGPSNIERENIMGGFLVSFTQFSKTSFMREYIIFLIIAKRMSVIRLYLKLVPVCPLK